MKTIVKFLCFILICLLSSICKNERQEVKELKLISWNCHDFMLQADTLRKAAHWINSQSPDIICLQERPHTNLLSYDTIKATFPAYPYKVTNGREDENLNIVIFSKYPLRDIKTYYLKDTYNKIIKADVDFQGQTFRLFNVHLQTFTHRGPVYNCKRRYRQSDMLKKEVKRSPYPVIICGDFNDLPVSYTVLNLLTELSDLSATWHSSFQELGNILKIDYILATPEFQKESYELIPNCWSDHKIQTAKLKYIYRK